MDVNGTWVGWGLGDVDPTVLSLKQFFLRKFAKTAAPLQASVTAGGTAAQTYDQTMVDFVTRMQTAYGDGTAVNPALTISGIINYAWKIRCGFLAPPKITILTAQGTGVDMWNQMSPQPYGAAMYVKNMYPSRVNLQPIGNYPASINNPWMGQSVQMGVNSAVSLLGGAPPIDPGDPVYPSGPIFLWGYSQGAILVSHLWRDETLNPGGRLHHRLNDWIGVNTYGNPCRCPGKANGNARAGWGMPGKYHGVTTGGIAGADCLLPDETPDWFMDYVWLGDDEGHTELYTFCAIGDDPKKHLAEAGRVGNLVYRFIQDGSFIDFIEIAEALFVPVGMVEEIYQALSFAIKGPNADHFAYNWLDSILYAQWVVETWTNNYIRSGGAVTAPPITVPAVPGSN